MRNCFHRSRNQNAPSGITKNLEIQALAAKHLYFKELRKQKKQHWEDFLEDVENIWCIAKYLPDRALGPSFSPISYIKTGPISEATSNAEIGASLLESFFAQPLPYLPPVQLNDTNNAGVAAQLTTPPIQKEDIRAAIFKASPLKAPG